MVEKLSKMAVFQKYFKEIKDKYLTGDYTEGTLRTPFENFIESLNNNFHLTQEPRRVQKLGVPDFKARRKSVKIGYIETKDLDKNLDNILESGQLKKYKESINNLILTNYRCFILIRKGQKIFNLTLFNKSDLNNRKFSISEDKIKEFLKLIETFFDYKLSTIKSAKELSKELSKKAKLLKELAKEQLEEDLSKKDNNTSKSSIYDFYEGLKELIKDIDIDDSSDAYAQTITYALFLAKINCQNMLNRNNAVSYIPKNIGIIKRIFMNISGDSLPSNISWIVDEIIDVLNASDIKNILSEIDFRGKKDRDPFTFFYEDFLNLYDPKKRKHMGIYYTPRPVVSFIVKSIKHILTEDFDKTHGFADEDVTVLDPAVGTGTFLWLVYLRTLVDLKERGLGGLIKNKIKNHILKDFYGFEILITPYIISHLKLTTVLNRWFYRFENNDRVQVYLTNTLEPSETHGLLPFMRELTEESITAGKIKKKPILVILGNPPYSVSSSNKSDWIMKKMQDYKRDLNERNIQPLDDDYIKFIRFAHWKIEENGKGVVGLITNNSYLDGIIHRQMRKSLLDTFDRIYILNLHGDSRKKEKCPDGSKDENVFDIQQGVAISLFVKNKKFKDKKVFYADLYGKREDKYLWLDRNRINTVKWQELKIQEPYYFFVRKDFSLQVKYNSFFKLDNIFHTFGSGVKTHRDHLLVGFSKDEVKERMAEFLDKNLNEGEIKIKFKVGDTRDWKLKDARKVEPDELNSIIRTDSYRPFDTRYLAYDKRFIDRGCDRMSIMQNFFRNNLALVTTRQTLKFDNVLVSDTVTDIHYVGGQDYVFPLYLYNENGEKQPNFTDKFFDSIKRQYQNQKITPEDIFYYIYAVLHSPTYRKKYAEFLKIDFPRIPFVKDYKKFRKLSEIGKELVELHLMKKILPTKVKFDKPGSNIVEFVKYKDKKVYINKEQFFDGISEDVWNFYIGGYQVLDKWLKSRKKRELNTKEIEHFLQIIEIIKQTIKYMKNVDRVKVF